MEKYHAAWIFTACGGDGSGVCGSTADGMQEENIKKLVLGDWYMEGYSRLEYAIYDDGSCQVRSGYGLGKWSIVNDDKLRISDFYGQTLIYKIEKISKKSMTLRLIWDGKESETADTFYHTAEEAEKH